MHNVATWLLHYNLINSMHSLKHIFLLSFTATNSLATFVKSISSVFSFKYVMSCSDLIVPVTWLIGEMTLHAEKVHSAVAEFTGILFAFCSNE